MTTISAECILKSQSMEPGVKPVATLLLRYPRVIHAEFMTHRVFSRNAASSRAIPVHRLIQDVLDDPFVPLHWGAEKKGMQAGDVCDYPVNIGLYDSKDGFLIHSLARDEAWHKAKNNAVEMAIRFADAGYHKQIVNRLLEPFAHITVVCTATEWDNFFALRDHPDAEPHIRILAREMRKAIEDAETHPLEPGEWHLPFVTRETAIRLKDEFDRGIIEDVTIEGGMLELCRRYSSACCASTSYKTVEGFDMTLARAAAIYAKLVKADVFHASPFEHQACADWPEPQPSLQRNLPGYVQQRALIEMGLMG